MSAPMTSLRWVTLSATLVLTSCQSPPSPADTLYISAADRLQQDTERARQLNAEAVALIEAGVLDEAEEVLRRALAADVMYGPAHNSLGKVLYARGHFYRAAWEFEYAIKLMPHRPEPRNNLGLVFEAVGRLTDAVQQYEEALAIEPDRPELLGNLARARIRRGDRDEEVRRLLSDLVFKDTRPDWVQWARMTLAGVGGPPPPPPEDAPVGAPEAAGTDQDDM